LRKTSEGRSEVRTKEVELIRHHNSNDPEVGYNRWPKHLTADDRVILDE
jgi:hypothetical protein